MEFPSPSLGCTPCVPWACTITCWLTFLERSLTWFTWKSWACVGTHWWFGLSVTWPTIPRAFRNWLDAQLKLGMFLTLPATSRRILSGIWAWPATVPILNVGVSLSSLLCFLLLPDGFSFPLACHDFSSSVRLAVLLHPNSSCVHWLQVSCKLGFKKPCWVRNDVQSCSAGLLCLHGNVRQRFCRSLCSSAQHSTVLLWSEVSDLSALE